MKRHYWAAACAWSLLVVCDVMGEPLVYERFENTIVGKIEGCVGFSNDVVGYGGLTVPNTRSGLFDGKAATAINYGTSKRITTPDFTVEAFIKLAGAPNFDMIASCWNEQGDNRAWALVVLPGGGLRFDVSPDGNFYAANILATGPRLIEPGKWYHVAAVSRGDTSRLFVNGREVGKLVRPQKGIFAKASANLKIGNADRYATDGPRPFHGNLDEVRITPAALTPEKFVKTREPMPEVASPGRPKRYEMPFVAKTHEEALAWQARARARLLELVARQVPRLSAQEVPIDPKLGPPQDKGAYTLHTITFQGNNKEGKRWPGLLAIPKRGCQEPFSRERPTTAQRPLAKMVPDTFGPPFPAMFAIHGHGGSAEAVFDPKSIYLGFADRFARGGYVVLAPSFTVHHKYAANVLWDLFRCVDILASRPDVDKDRIGVGGLSMGGEWTMWIASCDPRLKVAVVSGWMCTTEGVFSVPNCACWELPGFVGLMDVCEVHLAIAPRPIVFESAEFDGCFPIRFTREGFQRIGAGYKVFGAEEAVAQDIWPAGHEWHGAVAYPTVDKVLGGHAAKAK